MATHRPEPEHRFPPVLAPGETALSLTRRICGAILDRRDRFGWWLLFLLSTALTGIFVVAVTWLLLQGIGIWGVDIPVAWGFAIANFVWWIGIGHAGTLISAILYLLRQPWRTSINRFAEAMTIFAVICAGMFPLLHMGRPWFFYWLLPYPNTMTLWPQFRSPLVWDVFAVLTYLTVSLLFWYVGLVPDLATLRDRAERPLVRRLYGIFAWGWRGSSRHWRRYEETYLLLAGLATPLVVSVHTIVSFDFAVAILPGWHSTIFPPYFVAGAIFSGFAMVLTLAIPLRSAFGFEGLITLRHLNNCALVMLTAGWFVIYGYVIEAFSAAYGPNQYERYSFLNQVSGPYWYLWAIVVTCNVLIPQSLWWGSVRQNPRLLWVIAILINVGMWTERLMIVIVALSRDYLPARWGHYVPTVWDWATLIGTLGLFIWLFLLFARTLPSVAMAEMRKLATARAGELSAPEVSG